MEIKGDVVGGENIVRTPLERELNRVRVDLARYREDMRAVGITAEQIEGVIAKAQERIRKKFKEFKEKEIQDPLEIVKNALREAVQTEDELAIARYWCREINRERDRLTENIKNPPWPRRTDPLFQDWRPGEGIWEIITVLAGPVQNAKHRRIKIPSEFQERFLRKLGVLGVDEGMQNLFDRKFTVIDSRDGFAPQPEGQFKEEDRKTGWIRLRRIPTNIPGVNMEMNGSNIRISISPEALPKIQPKK